VQRERDNPRPIGLVAPLPPQVGGVASVAGWLLDHEREIGCRFETFDLWRPPDGQLGGRLQAGAIPRQLVLLRRFVRWLRRAPSVIHYCVACSTVSLARDLLFVAAARMAGKRVVAHVHGSEFADGGRARLFQVPAMRLLARLTVERVSLTPWATSELEAIGVSSRCIRNPLRVRGDAAQRSEPSSGPLRLLFVGSYGAAKGCVDLVDALAEARRRGVDATLRLVGKEMYDGEEHSLREQVVARELHGAVTFAGTRSHEQLPAEYESADVICLPSRREVLPMALLEGMSFGLPALASPVGGIPDVVESGRHGLLVRTGDVPRLADAIHELAANEQQRRAMGRAAAARARSLTDDDHIAEAWRSVYESRSPNGR